MYAHILVATDGSDLGDRAFDQAIAIAKALHADVMLFDEPTSTLDPKWVGEVLDLMRRVAESRQTVLIATREMQFAREIAHRVIFMDGGRIVEQGPPGAIFGAPQDPRIREFLRRVSRGTTISRTLPHLDNFERKRP